MENKGNSSFLNGMMWGILIGGTLVFLLGTKKGKRLLKIVMEEGLEGMSEFGEIIEEFSDEKLEAMQETSPAVVSSQDSHPTSEQKKPARRFFRKKKN